MRYYRDYHDMNDILERTRKRAAEELVEAKERFPEGTYVVASTEDGPFYGQVFGYDTNFIGRVVVRFYTVTGGETCAYLNELVELTPQEYAKIAKRHRSR